MALNSPHRVFISYTGQDLSAHADIAAKVLRALELLAIDHRDSGATGEPSVQWCMAQVDKSDLVMVLVAHRYGWVPSKADGGDGVTSITQLEVERAISQGKIVLPYILEDGCSWPTRDIEALSNPKILEPLEHFKADLRKTVAAFFNENPISLEGPISRDLPRAIQRIEKQKPSEGLQPSTKQIPTQLAPFPYDPSDPPSIEARMAIGLPKRILSINGGGAESAIGMGYLTRLEQLLQVRYGDPDFRLADYFDLITGVGVTGVAAIELGRRRTVSEAAEVMKHIYYSGTFKRNELRALWSAPFSDKHFLRAIQNHYGDLTLSDDSFTTAILIIGTSLNSSMPVYFSNHPEALVQYGSPLLVKTLVRAVCVPPTMLNPMLIESSVGQKHALTGGEASIGSDPSLMALLYATNRDHALKWRLGKYRLSLISVGDAPRPRNESAEKFENGMALLMVVPLLNALFRGAVYQSQTLMGVLGEDSIGDIPGLLGQSAALSYRAFKSDYSDETLQRLGILNLGGLKQEHFFGGNLEIAFDSFTKIGSQAGKRQIGSADFLSAFDVRTPVSI